METRVVSHTAEAVTDIHNEDNLLFITIWVNFVQYRIVAVVEKWYAKVQQLSVITNNLSQK